MTPTPANDDDPGPKGPGAAAARARRERHQAAQDLFREAIDKTTAQVGDGVSETVVCRLAVRTALERLAVVDSPSKANRYARIMGRVVEAMR